MAIDACANQSDPACYEISDGNYNCTDFYNSRYFIGLSVLTSACFIMAVTGITFVSSANQLDRTVAALISPSNVTCASLSTCYAGQYDTNSALDTNSGFDNSDLTKCHDDSKNACTDHETGFFLVILGLMFCIASTALCIATRPKCYYSCRMFSHQNPSSASLDALLPAAELESTSTTPAPV